MPKTIEVSVDEYLSTRKLVSKDGVVYRAAKMPKSFDAAERSATFVMTDETVDSYGDIVRAKGADLSRFDTNPICLLNHRSDMILGTWSDVKRIVKRIEGKATLAKAGTAPHIDMAYSLMEQGILRGASIGFMPIKVERRLDDNGEPMWSYDILEWQMFECSVVSIPANPSALARSISDGNMLARDYLEEVLDTYMKTPAGVIMRIADVEAAFKEGTGNKTSVVVEAADVEPSEWTLPEECKGIFTDDQAAELIALAAADGHDIATAKALELKAAKSEADEAAAVETAAFEAFLAEQVKSVADEVDIYHKLIGKSFVTLVKGIIVKHAGTDKLDKFEFAAAMTDEHRKLLAAHVEGVSANSAENKTGTVEEIADEAITKATESLFDRIFESFSKLFQAKSVEERIEPTIVDPEPVAPPTKEAISASLSKAAAIRERLVSKGLIEA